MIGIDREAFYVSVRVMVGNPEDQSNSYWYVLALDWPGLWTGGIDSGVVLPDGTFNFFRRGDVFQGDITSWPIVPE